MCCDLTVARERNGRRQVPIPDSTIVSMEQSLELPEPDSQSWERRSCVLFNNSSSQEGFLTESLSVILSILTAIDEQLPLLFVCSGVAKELIAGALANPEQQTSPLDHEMKVMITSTYTAFDQLNTYTIVYCPLVLSTIMGS